MHDDVFPSLVAAVRNLDPQPRQRWWVSVSFCVLDAVYSIGAHCDHHMIPVVDRVAADIGVDTPSVPMPSRSHHSRGRCIERAASSD